MPENGGGDTLFFHVGKLYESLPESHKTLLAGLKAKHTGRVRGSRKCAPRCALLVCTGAAAARISRKGRQGQIIPGPGAAPARGGPLRRLGGALHVRSTC